jgi:hypothetical protein
MLMSEAKKEQEEGTTSSAAESQGKLSGQATETVTSAATGASGLMVPRADLDKLQADLDNFKRIEEERKGKEKKRQEALLQEQGKYKDLYDAAQKEVETMKARLEKLDLAAKSMLEEEMKELPEDFDKTLIPNVDDYDKVTWLRKAKGLIGKKVEPRKGDGTPPAGGEPFAAMRGIYNHPTSPKH